MKGINLLLLVCFFLACPHAVAGQEASGIEYAPPMDDISLLSSNFGEMRPNHFHSGLDFKTGGVIRKKVYSIADGYVCRIGVRPGGYGRAVYVAHPDGTMSVYAHLDRFTPALERYLNSERYRLKQHDVDLYPDKSRFPVKRGQQLGYSGNSGMSFGPHLHFELREGPQQQTVNTLGRGIFHVADKTPPTIVQLYYYRVDTVSGVPVHTRAVTRQVKRAASGKYVLATDTPIVVDGPGYFAVEVTDRKEGVSNRFGIYRITEEVDGAPVFDLCIDRFAFSDTRYANAVAVYPLQKKSKNEVFRLAVLENNRMPIYRHVVRRGLLDGTRRQHVALRIYDDSKNISALDFDIIPAQAAKPRPERPANSSIVRHDAPLRMRTDSLEVSIPAGALYEPVFYFQSRTRLPAVDAAAPGEAFRLSDVYAIHDADVPLHKHISVSIGVDVPDTLRSRAVLAGVSPSGKLFYAGGHWRSGRVCGDVRNFGRYCAAADVTPPVVKSSFAQGADLGKAQRITFTLTDDFSGIAQFSGTIDGKWILFERDLIRKTVTHYFDDARTGTGKRHRLELKVTDGAGNVSIWRGEFFR